MTRTRFKRKTIQSNTRRSFVTREMDQSSEKEENAIETTCVLCEKNKITVERRNASPYLEDELMCNDCKLRYYLSRETLYKGLFGTSEVYCPWTCGVRCKPQNVETHERSCHKKTLKFLCLFENCTKILPIRVLIQHVHSEHTDNLIILDNSPKFKVPSPSFPSRKLIILHDKDYIQNEVYWQHIFAKNSNVYLTIQHVCSFKGQFHKKGASLTKFSAASTNGIVIRGDIIVKDQPAMPFDITPIINGLIKMTLKDPSALQLPEKLVPEFNCDVCADFLTVPIRLCMNGHSLCNDCFRKVTKCPKCKTDLSQARNYALERIVQEINTLCKYRDAGCREKPKVADLMKHMDRCYFRPYTCSICKVTMCYKDISQHTEDCLTMREFSVAFPIAEENGNYKARSPFTFSAFDELFVLHLCTLSEGRENSDSVSSNSSANQENPESIQDSICKNTDFTHYAMAFYIENFSTFRDVDYYFDLTISDPIENKSITFSAKCGLGNHVGVPKEYFTSGNTLQVSLEIYEKDQNFALEE